MTGSAYRAGVGIAIVASFLTVWTTIVRDDGTGIGYFMMGLSQVPVNRRFRCKSARQSVGPPNSLFSQACIHCLGSFVEGVSRGKSDWPSTTTTSHDMSVARREGGLASRITGPMRIPLDQQ